MAICLTNSDSLRTIAPAGLPTIPGIEIRLLPELSADTAWPVADSVKVVALFSTHPPPNLDAFPNVRWLQIESVGCNHLRQHRLPERQIAVTNARGIFDTPIAEWTLGMMINLIRDLRTLIRHQDGAVWERSARFTGELRGRTLGIWGYGGIGRETARLARAFGMNVHVLTRSRPGPRTDCHTIPGTGDPEGVLPQRWFAPQDKAAFLAGLDFLVLAMPLTHETDGLIDEYSLRQLPRGAFLLNPARGPLVQEAALLAVLRDGHLGGAALDAHYQYPLPPAHPLWAFPQVILTPHISGTTFSPHFQAGLRQIFFENARLFAENSPLINLVQPSDLA